MFNDLVLHSFNKMFLEVQKKKLSVQNIIRE